MGMAKKEAEHTLEFLLDFNGRVHQLCGRLLAEIRDCDG